MAVISVLKYKNLTVEYTNAQTQIAGVADNYFDAAYIVVQLQAFDPEIDLLTPYFNAYLAANTAYIAVPQAVINAVKALQEHVLRRAVDSNGVKFTDVNDWYGDTGSFLGGNGVSAEFAVLSNQAGHTITSTYIAP